MRNNKAEIATATMFIIGVIIGAIGGMYVANKEGYLPWFQTPYVPDAVTQGSDNIECNGFFDLTEVSTSFENISYKTFYSSDSPSAVIEAYTSDLREKGFELKTSGTTTIQGYTILYAFFIKGITLAGVAATGSPFSGGQGVGSCVIYAVGPVWEAQNNFETAG